MDTLTLIVVAVCNAASWLGILAVTRLTLQAQNRLLKSNDDLTSQVIAFKNPAAAMLYAQQQHAVRSEAAPTMAHFEADEEELQ